jgi:phosphomannomutase
MGCDAAAEPEPVVKSDDMIVLFDVDGTLTEPRKKITPDMLAKLEELKKVVHIGLVGGSDISKQLEQIGPDVKSRFDYTFSENGLQAFKGENDIATASLKKHLGDAKITKFINFALKNLAECENPVKRGTFIEFRNGMLNISPVGRACSQEERDEFEKFDMEHKVREKLINKMKEEFKDEDLLKDMTYSIGGQISFDVFPNGWDKRYALRFVTQCPEYEALAADEKKECKIFKEVHFFGDKAFKGGNDFEIYSDERTIGHPVKKYQDTIAELDKFLKEGAFSPAGPAVVEPHAH